MDRLFAFQNRSDTLQLYGCHFGLKPAGWSYDKHHHHLYELFCCMDGFAVQEMQGSSVPLAPGDWFLLRPGVSHTLTNAGPGPLAFFNFHFDLDDLEVRGRLGAAPFRLIPGRLAAGSGLPGCVAGLESLLGKQLISDSDPACPADAPAATPSRSDCISSLPSSPRSWRSWARSFACWKRFRSRQAITA